MPLTQRAPSTAPVRVERGIGASIVAPAALVLVVLLVLLGAGVWWRLTIATRRTIVTRAQVAASSLAGNPDLSLAITPGDNESLTFARRALDEALRRDPQIAYAQLLGPKGEVMARFQAADEEETLGPADVRARLASDAPDDARAGRLVDIGRYRLVFGCGDVTWSGVVTATSPAPAGGKNIGKLCLGISLTNEDHEGTQLLAALCAVGAAAVLVYILAMSLLVRRLSRRVVRIVGKARAVEGGDLSARVDDPLPDEIGLVARAFDQATARIGRTVDGIEELATALRGTATRIATAAESLRRGAAAQRRDAESSWSVADQVAGLLHDTASRAESVLTEARAGAAAAARIAAISETAGRGVADAERSVEEAAGGVRAIATAITDIAGRAEQVSGVASSTTSAVMQLNATIGRVRQTADAAAELATASAADAERGQDALASTIEGIERIRVASQAVSAVTRALEDRARQISAVLLMVRDFTERTKLLALNASIIAAQAGTEGQGFAVVADEIKELARRTGTSASEIGTLVAGISEDTEAARRAADAGAAAVAEGSERARVTSEALAEIFARMRESAQLSLSIATATEEQGRASDYVAQAMGQVNQSVGEIARATLAQRAESEDVARVAARLDAAIRDVAGAVREQRDGAREVASSVATLRTTIEQVALDQRGRATDGTRLRDAFTAIRNVAAGHEQSVSSLESAVAELEQKALALADELARVTT